MLYRIIVRFCNICACSFTSSSVKDVKRYWTVYKIEIGEGIVKWRLSIYASTGTDGRRCYSSNPFSISALEGTGLLVSRPGHFAPGKDPIPIVQEVGWASVPVWTGMENFVFTGIRYPDRPVLSESLYRRRYPGRQYANPLFIRHLLFAISCCLVCNINT